MVIRARLYEVTLEVRPLNWNTELVIPAFLRWFSGGGFPGIGHRLGWWRCSGRRTGPRLGLSCAPQHSPSKIHGTIVFIGAPVYISRRAELRAEVLENCSLSGEGRRQWSGLSGW